MDKKNLILNFGKLLFYDLLQNMPIKCLNIPKNEAKLVKISILSLSEKVPENRPSIKSNFRGGLFFATVSESVS